MIDLLGWVGSLCLGLCALPQAYHSWRTKSSAGLSLTFLLLWIVGEIATLAYILLTTAQLPLIVNYTVNLICLLIIIKYWKKK
jgi:uncharacterized protein with PQ loop repeat